MIIINFLDKFLLIIFKISFLRDFFFIPYILRDLIKFFNMFSKNKIFGGFPKIHIVVKYHGHPTNL